MKNKLLYIIIVTCLVTSFHFVAGATAEWVNDPADCPSLDGVEFPGQDCTPEDICGDSSGTAQCYDTNLLTAPSSGLSVTSHTADFDGGWLVNCFVTADASSPFCDNSGDFWCDRNETYYGSDYYRQTNCTGFGDTEYGACRSGYYNCFGDIKCEATSTSDCNATAVDNTRYTVATCHTNVTEIPVGDATCICDPSYFQCDGSLLDADGCEHLAGSNCGSNTGDKVDDQCFDTSNANCTNYITDNSDCNDDDSDSNINTCNGGDGCEIIDGTACLNSTDTGTGGTYKPAECHQTHIGGNCTASGAIGTYLDCDDSDSDGNVLTCNTGNGCEVENNSACTVGDLSGTIMDCLGCVVDDVDYGTSGVQYLWSSTTNAFLDFWQFGTAPVVNFTTSNNKSFYINNTDVVMGRNITLAEEITFGLGEIIDNIMDGWLRLTGNVEVTGNLNVTHNFSIANEVKFYYNGSDLIIE